MKKKRLITKEWTMEQLVQVYPYPAVTNAINKLGLHCIGCQISAWETIEQGVLAHGLTPLQLEKLLDELNAIVKDLPANKTPLQTPSTSDCEKALKPRKQRSEKLKTTRKSKTI
jgi:hybrid cluster-associated redox disulfide protein